MRLFCIIVTLSALAFSSCLANDVLPALIYTKSKNFYSNEYQLGTSMSRKQFNEDLSKLFSHSSPHSLFKVAIVLMSNLNDQDIRLNKLSGSFDENAHVIYKPAVVQPYATLVDYLNENSIQNELYQQGSIDDALKTFNEIKQNFDAVVLTGVQSDLQSARKKRALLSANSNSTIPVYGKGCAASFQSISWIAAGKDNMLQIKNIDFNCSSNDSAVLLMEFEPQNFTKDSLTTLRLEFTTKSSGYWFLMNSTATTNASGYDVIYTGLPSSMETPLRYSFACTRAHIRLVKVNETKSKIELAIDNLQLQPFNMKVNGSAYTFGKVNYCSSFFSSGIWMATMTFLVMLAILATGVFALTSINTMNRFDDPKGKPLTIAAEK